MFERAETWLKDRGVDHIVAPFNGAAILGVGVRSAAYDEDPIFPFLWQPPYYKEYLAGLGYNASYPLWYYTVDFTSREYQATKRRVSRRRASSSAPSKRSVGTASWKNFLVVFNETFKDELEFHL
jgi:hypothetical protein